MLQFQNSETAIKIGHQALNIRVVSAVLKQILCVSNVAETTKVSVELTVIFVLGTASQVIESESFLRCVHRVSIIVPKLSLVTRISREPHQVPPVGNAQTGSMHFSPYKIRKILLMWSLVHYRSSIYMFMPY